MTTSTNVKILSGGLPAALAILALAVFSASAHAADYDEITVHGAKTTESEFGTLDYRTRLPVETTTVNFTVKYDPVTLTTNSGVALLKDSVADAARDACWKAGLLSLEDDGTCTRKAISSAQPQIAQAVAQARSADSHAVETAAAGVVNSNG
jgi:UrcA family protein